MPNMQTSINLSRPGRYFVPTLKHTTIGNALNVTPTALQEELPEHNGDLEIRSSLVSNGSTSRVRTSRSLSSVFAWKPTFSAFNVANVRLRLRGLAEVARSNLVPELGSQGMTSSQDSGYADPSRLLHLGILEGWRISIVVDYRVYDQLCDARDSHAFEQLSFLFAVLLCHEIMHAAYHSVDYIPGTPFEQNLAAETGTEWKNYIFGGIPCDGTSVIDWPCPSTALHYRHKDWPIATVQEPTRAQVFWTMEEEFVRELSTDYFCNEGVPCEGAPALKPARYQGRRARVQEDGKTEDLRLWAENYAKMAAVPDGYKLDSYDIVVPLDHWNFMEDTEDERREVPDGCWETLEKSSGEETCVAPDDILELYNDGWSDGTRVFAGEGWTTSKLSSWEQLRAVSDGSCYA